MEYFVHLSILFGIYAILSLGLNLVVGYTGLAKPNLFGLDFSQNCSFLLLTIVILILVYLACNFIAKSSFGRVLKAIREDEKTISVFGYNTRVYKLIIFMIGSSIAAVAG